MKPISHLHNSHSFIPFKGDNVSSEYCKIQGVWMSLEPAPSWYREMICDDPFKVEVLGWGSKAIFWRDLKTEERRELWLNWAAVNNPKRIVALGLAGC